MEAESDHPYVDMGAQAHQKAGASAAHPVMRLRATDFDLVELVKLIPSAFAWRTDCSGVPAEIHGWARFVDSLLRVLGIVSQAEWAVVRVAHRVLAVVVLLTLTSLSVVVVAEEFADARRRNVATLGLLAINLGYVVMYTMMLLVARLNFHQLVYSFVRARSRVDSVGASVQACVSEYLPGVAVLWFGTYLLLGLWGLLNDLGVLYRDMDTLLIASVPYGGTITWVLSLAQITIGFIAHTAIIVLCKILVHMLKQTSLKWQDDVDSNLVDFDRWDSEFSSIHVFLTNTSLFVRAPLALALVAGFAAYCLCLVGLLEGTRRMYAAQALVIAVLVPTVLIRAMFFLAEVTRESRALRADLMALINSDSLRNRLQDTTKFTNFIGDSELGFHLFVPITKPLCYVMVEQVLLVGLVLAYNTTYWRRE